MEPIVITDPDDDRLADYVNLRDPDHRTAVEGDQFFITEGATAIRRLVTSRFEIRSVVLIPLQYERLRAVVEILECPVYIAERSVLFKVAGFNIHRGAVAAANRGAPLALDAVLRSSRTIAVLEGLNDHENLGAIARSARALGIDALLIDPQCADPFYRRCVRVSMGEILHLPIVRCLHWPDDLQVVEQAGFQLVALTPNPGAVPLHHVVRQPNDRVAVLLGAEGPGLSAEILARATAVRIPINPEVDSLNVGHAAAVAFAHFGVI
jgi:tRNA G18 (ribose-2'-O)-methylase SpoU